MDFAQVQTELNDLPTTFQRPGAPFTQWIDADTAGLYRYTQAADGTVSQASFLNAVYGWLDFWGLLFGIPRNTNESDAKYMARIVYTINTGAGSPNAITMFISFVFGITVTLQENLPTIGYTLVFPPTVTPTQIDTILAAIVCVRPAGVPITNVGMLIGSYLNSVNFIGAPRVTGAYLGGSGGSGGPAIPAATNNSSPLLPDLYLTDPFLNPGLAVPTT
jgi:hypothetical protein